VNAYVNQIQKTNFMNDDDLGNFLQSLLHTFTEFRSHEMIENRFIMRRLKNKLKKLSIRNQAVCNCHKDSHLIDMLGLVQQGFNKMGLSDQDRNNYALQLKKSLEDFTEDFLPHMKQEEEIFQPLLLKYFSYHELCEIKRSVIQQHLLEMQNRLLGLEKSLWDSMECDSSGCESEGEEEDVSDKLNKVKIDEVKESIPATSVTDLPPEITIKIFSFLGPKDLCRSAQVCKDWSKLAVDSSLWHHIHPRRWAKGDWSFRAPDVEEEDEDESISEEDYIVIDDDADIDESQCPDEEENDTVVQLQREARVLLGLTKDLLPVVGQGVQTLNLAHCRALTNGLLQKMLRFCPNVEYLDLSQTKVNDSGLKGIGKNYCCSKLRHLSLSGCSNITDASLVRLAMALTQPAVIDCNMPNVVEEYNNNQVQYDECLCEQYNETREKLLSLPTGEQAVYNNDQYSGPEKSIDKNYQDKSSTCLLDTKRCCEKREKRLAKTDIKNKPPLPNESQDTCAMNCKPSDGSRLELQSSILEVGVPNDKEMTACCQAIARGAKHCDKAKAMATGLCNKETKSVEIVKTVWDQIEEDCRPVPDVCSACCQNWNQDEPDPIEDCARLRGNPAHKKPLPHDGDQQPLTHGGCSPGGYVNMANDEVANVRQERDPPPPGKVPIELLMGITARQDIYIDEKEAYDVPGMPVKERDKPAANHLGKREGEEQGLWRGNEPIKERTLAYLNLSGCYLLSDMGLRALAGCGPYPHLYRIDLSGCLNLTGAGIFSLVDVSPGLDPEQLFYCDNILDGPFPDTASGCQNLCCGSRMCCRHGF
jgi:F-box/leucine-rich repeat protein 5